MMSSPLTPCGMRDAQFPVAYYNEVDPYAAQWLRNLIAAGHIAPGDVDERSIEDVKPCELAGYTQCHFFAGIGVWSLALRRAGWDDSRSVWTGSCPCQPFSAAGKRVGFADERHLWPDFFHLVGECRPAVIYGEQVANSDVGPWLDLVQADVEDLGYAFGCVAFPSAGVGAPHIRDRAYWMAQSEHGGLKAGQPHRPWPGATMPSGSVGWLADCEVGGWREERPDGRGLALGDCAQGIAAGLVHGGGDSAAGPTNGLWRAADWLACRDGKWRPIEPGTSPLATGAPARVGRLRAYGNAINAEAARVFVEAAMSPVGLAAGSGVAL